MHGPRKSPFSHIPPKGAGPRRFVPAVVAFPVERHPVCRQQDAGGVRGEGPSPNAVVPVPEGGGMTVDGHHGRWPCRHRGAAIPAAAAPEPRVAAAGRAPIQDALDHVSSTLSGDPVMILYKTTSILTQTSAAYGAGKVPG